MTAQISISIPGEPVAFARARSKGKQRFNPRKQADYMTAARHFAAMAMRGRPLFAGPVEMEVDAVFIPPASWSKKKREAATWKATKSDLSNILKLLEDSFNGIIYADDAQIAKLSAAKRYGAAASISVVVRALA